MSADQWFGAAIIAGAIVTIVVFRRESRLRREASPVVPLDDLLHEQDSAEAYDDLPEASAAETGIAAALAANGWIEVGPGYWVKNAPVVDEMRLREQQEAELEALFALPAFERGQ